MAYLVFLFYLQSLLFPGGSVVKNLPANVGDADSTPGLGSFLTWEVSWTELPGWLQSARSQEPDMTE